MKKLFCICMILLLVLAVPAAASEIPEERQLPLLVDDAGLLASWDAEEVLAKLEEISERQECEVAIVTVDSLEGQSATAFADDFYDYFGYGYGQDDDGILLLISMEYSDWAITTYGFGIHAFTDAGQEYIMDRVVPLLGDEKYYDAFLCFADLCDEFLTQAVEDRPFDVGNLPKHFNFVMVLIGLGIGLFIALIVVSVMASGMKSVRRQQNAANYTRPGSFTVRYGSEMFLYHNVSRVRKESSSSSSGGSSTHRSSSGRSHGGSSGKF